MFLDDEDDNTFDAIEFVFSMSISFGGVTVTMGTFEYFDLIDTLVDFLSFSGSFVLSSVPFSNDVTTFAMC